MPERVLVVDDEASVRGALAKILRYEDYEVIEAADGPSALELVGRERLDLVFLDIKMPGMDGLEVLGRLAEM
jgi:two-component system response regulator (stage 0 sporulation protein F)